VALMLAKDPSLTAQAAYRVMRDTSYAAASVSTAARSKGIDACAAVITVTKQGHCRAAGDSSVQAVADARESRAALR
jgi:hypothetical protein